MARYTGKDLVVRWIYSGGTQNVTGYRRSFNTSESVDDADATCGTVTYRDHLPTFTDMTSTLEYLEDSGSDGTAIFEALAPQTEGTVEWSPQGSASGKPKYTSAAYVAKRDRTAPYDDVVTVSVDFQHTEVPSVTTW